MVDIKKSALMLMDFQNYILQSYIADNLKQKTLDNAKNLLYAARQKNMMVIHVVVCFRKNYPEISLNNKIFSDVRLQDMAPAGSHTVDIIDSLKPLSGEIIIEKRRVSAFSCSDLNMILRVNNIQHLYLAGVATSHVVLSTFKQALDLDYNVNIIGDACGDLDSEIHQFLLDKIFPQGGSVLTTETILEKLKK